ncbi:MAG: hypothetical protein NT132_05230 [Microbacterium sp.]|uniref:hypothetical protein n=1 Tax=Microbacterium sp. TaxID=51671 RepID=UPI0026173542|nr:hypothetical protein [Microbacterium sp.]MCX6501799.1 hypothetical protein [Microbacterium sp.]
MPLDDYQDSFNMAAADSFNSTVDNDLTVGVDLADSFNTDDSVNDSGNLDVGISDSGNTDSHNEDNDTHTWSLTNTWTDSSTTDNSDNSTSNSGNTSTDNSQHDSGNTATFTYTDDHTINVGNREYNTGFGDVTFSGGAAAAAAASGTGSSFVDGRVTIVDGSVNQNIDGGHVGQYFGSQTVVASGDDAIAAGDGVSITTQIDSSTHMSAGGDINIGNETTIDMTVGSYNEYTSTTTETDSSTHTDISDSWNDYSQTYTATDSFTSTVDWDETTTIDADVDAIVDSHDALIADDFGL